MKKLVLLAFCLSFAFAIRDGFFYNIALDQKIKDEIYDTSDLFYNIIELYNLECENGNLDGCYKKNMIENIKYLTIYVEKNDDLQKLCEKGYKKACDTLKTGKYSFDFIYEKDCKGEYCDKEIRSIRLIKSCKAKECENTADIFLSKIVNRLKETYKEIDSLCKNNDEGSCVAKYCFLNEPILGLKDNKFDGKKTLQEACKKSPNSFACAEYAKKFVNDKKEKDEIYKNNCKDIRDGFADPEICYDLAMKSSGDEKYEYMKQACLSNHKDACVYMIDESDKKGDRLFKFQSLLTLCSLDEYKYCYIFGKDSKYYKFNSHRVGSYDSQRLIDLSHAKEYLGKACKHKIQEACDELEDLKDLEELDFSCRQKDKKACEKLEYLKNLREKL